MSLSLPILIAGKGYSLAKVLTRSGWDYKRAKRQPCELRYEWGYLLLAHRVGSPNFQKSMSQTVVTMF